MTRIESLTLRGSSLTRTNAHSALVFDRSREYHERLAAFETLLPALSDPKWTLAAESLLKIDTTPVLSPSLLKDTFEDLRKIIRAFLTQDAFLRDFNMTRDDLNYQYAEALLLEFESRRNRSQCAVTEEIREYEYLLLLMDVFSDADCAHDGSAQNSMYSGWIAGLVVLAITTRPGRFFISLHEYLEGSIASPASAVVILMNGAIQEIRTFGYEEIANQKAVDPERTLFDLGSMSKVFTAVASLQLVDRGLLDLSTSVRAYLPWFPASLSSVQVSHLLHNRSGLQDYFEIIQALGIVQDDMDNQTILRLCSDYWSSFDSLKFEPGSLYEYANVNYVLLSEIVEKLTKTPFARYLYEQVFTPINMLSTRVLEGNCLPHTARGYTFNQNQYQTASNSTLTAGDCRVFSTVLDMAAWHRFVQRGELQTLLSEESCHTLLHPDGPRRRYAGGLRTDSQSGIFGHAGWDEHGTGISLFLPGAPYFSLVFLTKAALRAEGITTEQVDETSVIATAIALAWCGKDIQQAISDF